MLILVHVTVFHVRHHSAPFVMFELIKKCTCKTGHKIILFNAKQGSVLIAHWSGITECYFALFYYGSLCDLYQLSVRFANLQDLTNRTQQSAGILKKFLLNIKWKGFYIEDMYQNPRCACKNMLGTILCIKIASLVLKLWTFIRSKYWDYFEPSNEWKYLLYDYSNIYSSI